MKTSHTAPIGETLHLTSTSFENVVSRPNSVVLVDFWAPWCPPCRAMGPAVDQVAKDFEGRAVVAKVDIDQAQDLAARFGIQSIPTVIVFKNGVPQNRSQGAQSARALAAQLNAAMG
jgi:thioredoxin 1